jgi:hypothetical protein
MFPRALSGCGFARQGRQEASARGIRTNALIEAFTEAPDLEELTG